VNIQEKVNNIVTLLEELYPQARTALRYSNAWELLVATILSAQCTDKRVNEVTVKLFEKYPTIEDFAKVPLELLEKEIYSTGFYKHKAYSIKNSAMIILEKYGGKFPNTLEALVELPGVGRKTANVVLANVFNQPAIIVDTHVKRLSRLLGLTKQKDPDKIEQELMEIIPREKWSLFSHSLIEHGRKICIARKPRCNNCIIRDYCDFYLKDK